MKKAILFILTATAVITSIGVQSGWVYHHRDGWIWMEGRYEESDHDPNKGPSGNVWDYLGECAHYLTPDARKEMSQAGYDTYKYNSETKPQFCKRLCNQYGGGSTWSTCFTCCSRAWKLARKRYPVDFVDW